MQQLIINSQVSLDFAISQIKQAWEREKYITVDIQKKKTRTQSQNRALHVYYSQLAVALNNAKLDMRRTLRPEIAITWQPDTVKKYLWLPIQLAKTSKGSTKQLTTTEVNEVFNILNHYLKNKLNILVPWPEKK